MVATVFLIGMFKDNKKTKKYLLGDNPAIISWLSC